MPLVKMDGSERPHYLKWTGFGYSHFVKGQDPGVELHFHDADEYWICTRGRLTVLSEGVVYEMSEGDMLVTLAGDEHKVLEILEDCSVIWIEDALKPGGRAGHLHRE